MEVLYATGIRHSETHKLDLYDIDTTAHRLTVRLGKGQRESVANNPRKLSIDPRLVAKWVAESGGQLAAHPPLAT
jgi:site-specific recombinase XerC